MAQMFDSELGRYWRLTTAASVGSYYANSATWSASTGANLPLGGTSSHSFWVRSSIANTTVGFQGIGFRDSAPNFLGPHGTPSGGDWAVGRAGGIFLEGTVGAFCDGCLFTTLDGNAVFLSGYNRNASITNSEFVSIGETAITQWGYTDGSPVPGMGFDARAGNQPRGTYVGFNYAHDVGIFVKQNDLLQVCATFEPKEESFESHSALTSGERGEESGGGPYERPQPERLRSERYGNGPSAEAGPRAPSSREGTSS
jgi:hypothetical protein